MGKPGGLEERSRTSVDVHEVAGLDVQSLQRCEIEGPIGPDRPAEDAAPLVLAVRRFLTVNRGPERIESLEMILGVQVLVAMEQKQLFLARVRARFGHDVDHTADGVAELRGYNRGEDFKLADRFLTQTRLGAAQDCGRCCPGRPP